MSRFVIAATGASAIASLLIVLWIAMRRCLRRLRPVTHWGLVICCVVLPIVNLIMFALLD